MSDQESVGKGKRVPRERSRQSALVPEPSVNMDELRELIALLRENGLAEFELEREGFRVRLRRETGREFAPAAEVTGHTPAPTGTRTSQSPQLTTPSPVHPGAQAETAASEDQDLY